MQQDRRRNKRTSMPTELVIKKVGGRSRKEEVAVEIVDVSNTGVGFNCSDPLQIGEVYESYLTLWTKEVLHALLQVVRIELTNDGYSYGAIFIGMPEMDAARIEVYQTVNDSQ